MTTGENWTREEVEAIVDDYFAMLSEELENRPFSKAEHRRALRRRIPARSDGSIEFKHCNVSAVLNELGMPYISGYQPRANTQGLLREVIIDRLERQRRSDIRRPWTREELLVVLRYYLQTEFGRLHANNPEVRAIAERLGRTPGSVAMKAVNFASLDPQITGTGRRGLTSTSAADREVWEQMRGAMNLFEEESASTAAQLGLDPFTVAPESVIREARNEDALSEASTSYLSPLTGEGLGEGETESFASVTVRRKQDFFRRMVLAAYKSSCAITGINVPDLLNASHIIPWSADPSRRLDPTNGIALNALHDRAFDRGLITFTNELRVIVSTAVRREPMSELHRSVLASIAGRQATFPVRFTPDPIALEYHRDILFQG